MAMQGEAVFSACQRYRYRLTRELDGALFAAATARTITFIMLNPSTADANTDDPTIRRCKGFARGWGYGRLLIVNLFAFRATDPRDMWSAHERGVNIVGERNEGYTARIGAFSIEHRPPLLDNRNDSEIVGAAFYGRQSDGIVVCAWGKGGGKNATHAKVIAERVEHVAKLVGGDLWCLGTNGNGTPKHPLYLAEDTPAQIWRSAA